MSDSSLILGQISPAAANFLILSLSALLYLLFLCARLITIPISIRIFMVQSAFVIWQMQE
jgi:hypothetical protein